MIIESLKSLAVPIDQLRGLPNNPRIGDVDAVARSLSAFGQRKPIVARKDDGTIIAGNHTWQAAKKLGWTEIAVAYVGDDDVTAKAYALADNRTAELGSYDEQALKDLIEQVHAVVPEFVRDAGWSEEAVKELVAKIESELPQEIDEDEIPESPVEPVTKLGDIWQLGRHRLMCGDSTVEKTVAKLMNEKKATLLHADPPYGMGKEKDGVLNDNLYGNKLDEFQISWWRVFRKHIENNGSAYIWGNPINLWRLWFVGGLNSSERLTFRNQILWQQEGVSWGKDGMSNLRQYANMGEHCLFFMFGEQGFNNNSDNYWDGWEPIRAYLETEMKKCGWTTKNLNEITGTQMAGHWVTKSQWTFITQEHYEKIQKAAQNHDAFKRDHDAFKRDYDALKRDFYSTRSYFDSSHSQMSDIWQFDRVKGEERHGHATPKPVALMQRILKSSLPENGLVAEPFGGSGSTLIAAEQTNRTCYMMELDSKYCDVIIKRWETLTGEKAVLVQNAESA